MSDILSPRTRVQVNEKGGKRYPSLANCIGRISSKLPVRYDDGTLEYVVRFGKDGDWEWLNSDEFEVIPE